MKKISSILLVAVFLSSCNGAFTRVKNIVSFTNQLKVESPSTPIHIPSKEFVNDWNKDAHINTNIAIDKRVDTEVDAKPKKGLLGMMPKLGGSKSREKVVSYKLKLSDDISAAPIVVDDKIIVLSTDGYLTAFDASDFKKLWETHLHMSIAKGQYYGGGITYHEGKLFVTNGSKTLSIIDPKNGEKILTKQFPDILITKPTIHRNLVLLLTMGNQLYGMDMTRNILVLDHGGTAEMLTSGKVCSPIVDSKGRILVSYSSGQLYLLDSEQAGEIWQFDLSLGQHLPGFLPVNISAKPIFEGDNIYIAENNGEFYKLDAERGGVVWKRKIEDVQTMNIFGNIIVVTTNGRQVAALNKEDGKTIWVTDIGDGKTFDRNKLKALEFVSTLMINDVLTLSTRQGFVYKISPHDGAILNTETLGKKIDFVTAAGRLMLFGGNKVSVYE